MRNSKSDDELSKSSDSIFEPNDANTTTGLVKLTNYGQDSNGLASTYEATPPPTPTTKINMSSNLDHKQAILQLNEDTSTWKITQSKKIRNGKNSKNQNRNILQSSFMKFHAYIKPENAPEFRFRLMVAFLFMSILTMVLLTRYLHYHMQISLSIINQIYLHSNTRKITFIDKDGNSLLHINYGLNIPRDTKPVNCGSFTKNTTLCLDWKYRAHLSVKSYKTPYNNSFQQEDPVTCYNFRWQSYEKYSSVKDCFDMSDSHWFGMGDLYNLKWPLNRMSIAASPFITSHRKSDQLSGSIIGRTWFLSKGISISVPLEVPLFVSINSTDDPNKVCFISRKTAPYYTTNLNHYFVHLEYTVCLAQNLSTLQNYIYEHNGGRNTESANTANTAAQQQPLVSNSTSRELIHEQHDSSEDIFLERIIWSTNANVLPNFTQQAVQSYVDQITNYGLAGIILLDSRWENSIGELRMNETTFNNPKVLVNILHNKGFKIMLTVSPTLSLRSPIVDSASSYLFRDSTLHTPLLTRCVTDQSKVCALVNLTNPVNSEQFRRNIIKELLSHQVGLSVDGLYFQGIQSSLIPRHINFDRSINPDKFLEYTNNVVKALPTSLGISTSVNSRGYQGYATIYPRESSWAALQSIIPSVLSLGLLGYPLVNADTVGGIHLFTKLKNETDYINKELYLRWLELVIFLPVVQFAEPPGGNDLDVVKIAKKLLKLRSDHCLPAMKASLQEYYLAGTPIIRPMWWSENEQDAYRIGDQFFVGNDIIVAPIVEEGKTERDVYLPHGWWKDEILAQVIRGGKWMRKYQVPLDKVAFFVRTEPSPPMS